MIPSAKPGGRNSARIAEEAKAAPDPNPPLDTPANSTAAPVTAKKDAFISSILPVLP